MDYNLKIWPSSVIDYRIEVAFLKGSVSSEHKMLKNCENKFKAFILSIITIYSQFLQKKMCLHMFLTVVSGKG